MRLMQATLKVMPEPPVPDLDALAERLANEHLKNKP
jgi:translation elongation factor EF-1beta